MQFKRLDPDDIDLVVKTLKEFTEREAPLEKRLEWDRTDTCPSDVVRAMLGPDVGLHLVFIPADYDGMGELVPVLPSYAEMPRLTQLLLDRGFSEEAILKFWGGNFLRVMREAAGGH